ncbi:unnamed protein product, partial [Discosporangium mesarthrocarpum]
MPFHFHDGELFVQRRAGTYEQSAEALAKGWVGTTISSSGDSQMEDADLREVYLSSVDEQGRVWASAVVGQNPGFVTYGPSSAGSVVLTISSGQRNFLTYRGDPLEENIKREGAPVGMLLKGLKNRRRYRIDGHVTSTRASALKPGPWNSVRGGIGGPDLSFKVSMAMGNCPKYVHVMKLVGEDGEVPREPLVKRSTSLSEAQRRWVASSDTFILATHAGGGDGGGADASNRGGNPGFVTAPDERTIVFPDYSVSSLTWSRAGLLWTCWQ